MFMEIAIGAIGIGIVLMVGYLVIGQVRSALPVMYADYNNTCYGAGNTSTATGCLNSCAGAITDNSSLTIRCVDSTVDTAIAATQVTVFAGFGLVAVGVIVLAAFGLISVFK